MRMTKFNATKYVKHRKHLLKEEMDLVYQKDKINKDLRKIRKELKSWDLFLLRGDK